MDYKEKYEMALEGIQEILGSGEDSIKMSRLQLRLQGIFPELKESEDEWIRKAIHIYLDWLDGKKDYAPRGEYTINDMIDWIEKQGKHQKFRDSIQVGDKVTRNEDGVLVNLSQLNRVAKKDEKQGEQKLNVNDNAKEMFIKALERVEEQNAKGYKLTDCDKNSWWEDFKAYTTSKQILANSAKTCKDEQKPAWSEEDEKNLNEALSYIKDETLKTFVKDRVQPQPKQEWSKEDEQMLNDIIKDLVHPWNEYIPDRIEDEIIWLKNRLKSLRPQNRWKPSDEQMNALNYVVNLMASSERPTENDLYYNILKSLRQQLMKLKE